MEKEDRKYCTFAHLCILLSLVMSVSCFPSRVEKQYIEPLGLNFRIQVEYESVKISFGEIEASEYPNYIETQIHSDCGGSPFYFLVDNTSGIPKVKHMFFAPSGFYNIHIPDYLYSIDYFMVDNTFGQHVRKLTRIDRDSVAALDHYVVEMWPAAYDRYMDYRIFDTGEIADMDSYIALFVDNSPVISYPHLSRVGEKPGYRENTASYGEPSVRRRFKVTDGNRKEMMGAGWLFLDTMDVRDEPVLEIVKWKVDEHILSIIYRIGPDGERTPVNGARYSYGMERRKDKIYYK